ncbi:MAG: DUF1273 domain-containing protein [Ruminococcaceae bacterium]|nr:DUF1273 domain-containing protein [Oscillospiraceae bacterium]
MVTCTFFGHRNCTVSLSNEISNAIVRLITEHSVSNFLVGNNGNFDIIVADQLLKLKKEFPHIECAIVLAYMPGHDTNKKNHPLPTLYPENLETVPPRFAIIKRNEWMVRQSEYVVTYVRHSSGGASRFSELSKKLGKTVIEL